MRNHRLQKSKIVRRVWRLCPFERLEARLPLAAEGQPYSFDFFLDASEMGGAITSIVQWGDGTSSPATVVSSPAAGPLKVRLDYTYDTSGFFQSAARRSLIQAVSDSIARRFSDSLTAIQPVGTDRWDAKFKNPATGVDTLRPNMTIAANEILVYVGARAIASGDSGLADRGGYNVSSSRQVFVDTVKARGQTGALANPQTDFGPWGGSIALNSTKNWYSGFDANGIGSDQIDMASVFAHELMHVFGFGTTPSFDRLLINSRFTGASATQEYGSAVPLADADHFANDLNYKGRRPLMVPEFLPGERLLPSRLDLASLNDLGWQLIAPSVRVAATHVFGDNGNFPATISLVGAQLGAKSYPLTIPITNAVPTFLNRSNASGIAEQPIQLNRIGQFTDAGFGSPLAAPPKSESFTYRINWGDNTPAESGAATIEVLGSATALTRGYFNGLHTYANAGTYTVSLTVTDDDNGSAQQSFQIVVAPKLRLTATIDRSSFSEAAGAGIAMLTVSRPAGTTAAALLVQLLSSDTSEITLPSTAIIPAGASSINIGVNAIDDALFDGNQLVVLSASAVGFDPGTVSVTVLDYQPIALLPANKNLHEDIPDQRSTAVTVTVRSPAPTGGARVNLTSTPSGILTLPASVTIPAGATQATFMVTAINDDRPQRLRQVTIAASGPGMVATSTVVTVNDSDPFRWTNPVSRFDVNNNGDIDPLDVLMVINEINRRGSRELDPLTDLTPPYLDANPDGSIDPLDVLVIVNEINRRN